MGKNGAAMRAAKLQTRITYTHEQIEEIKRKAANEALDRERDEVKKEVRKYLDAEFEERQKRALRGGVQNLRRRGR